MNPIEQDECFRTPFKVAEALVAAAEDITRGQVGTNGRDLQLLKDVRCRSLWSGGVLSCRMVSRDQ